MASRKIPWLITYSDMVTLLMAFFLCILTFSSLAGLNKRGALNRDSVVWRPRLRQTAVAPIEPLYRDPSGEMSGRILHALEVAAGERSGNNFAIRLPLGLLFREDGQVSSSGTHLLHALAANLRDLPWDLQFQVSDADSTQQAVQLCQYLMTQEGYEPARLAVGHRPEGEESGYVRLVLFRRL